MVNSRIGVLGAGAWGTALAVIANRSGNDVIMWTRNENVFESVAQTRMNNPYLPDVFIDPDIRITTHMNDLCNCDMILLVVPSQSVRATCIALSDLISPDMPIVLCTKGIERGSLALMSEVVDTILPNNPLAILSGPNFAREAADGLPTATTLASRDQKLAEKMIYALGATHFRPYYSDDIIGVQVGGAVKNVIAIASGICTGRGLGENARAALISRGIAEMCRLAKVKGGREDTLMGLSGFGDLILTAGSSKSRNMAFGMAIGAGKRPAELMPGNKMGLTEGVFTTESVYQLSQRFGVSMPICRTVHEILEEKLEVHDGILQLLQRPFAAE